jgi:hypothetical protein
MKKRAIPKAPASAGVEVRLFSEAVKERLELISGERGGSIAPLPATASSADVIAKVNEIIERLQ